MPDVFQLGHVAAESHDAPPSSHDQDGHTNAGSPRGVTSPAGHHQGGHTRSPLSHVAPDRHAPQLVLSLFPGADLLGRAFESEGFSVVRGPDLILDQRIEDFHVPPGRFDGVIGGPPCVNYSDANRNRNVAEGDRLVMEFLRVVSQARPAWWLMENVRCVPDVRLHGYAVQRLDVRDWEFGGKTGRLRHVQFGSLHRHIIRPARLQVPRPVTLLPVVTTASSGVGDRYSRRCSKMGVSPLRLSSFTSAARRRVIGNGVPWGMGCALARAVTAQGPVTDFDCVCGCGRPVDRAVTHATAACRQRTSRRRRGHGRELVYEADSRKPG